MNTTIVVAVTDIFFYTKVRDALRPQGYTLERIRNQDEVAEKMTSTQPAALILNMNDLAVDAFKALETIQSNPALRSLPILAFANHEEVDTWRRAKELGVTKVVSRNEFSARTKDLVDELIHPQPASQS
ncbi:MAG: histidine kinase [Nitrospira sp.]|nr:histidine kinase [Nitrospira sp.]MCW5795440.1 histidine kinase [Nitrospira sp.]HMV57699.1 histidine kinase [Nitrospira sp.]HNE34761.1 histidine kinase [Nitrospira sp.]HNG01903.1 histidine kinase [Nitrospira sp.]